MLALNARLDHPQYIGVGGESMNSAGLESIFAMSEVAVMGPLAIAKRLPSLVRRVYETVDALVAAEPDILVIVDSPEFTHPVAKRIRKRRPDIPIVDYVSPSVWAWRPGRARKMRPYVDSILALLPFEPAVHEELGGPPCSYVGHPLVEQIPWVRSLDPNCLAQRLNLVEGVPIVVVLPGSRSSEVSRLAPVFGNAIAALSERVGGIEVIVPTVPSVRKSVIEETARWSISVHVVEGEVDKYRAFRLASAALAASGTVTLELGIAATPMVVAYIVEPLATMLRPIVKVPSIILANLVLGRNAFPEFIQEECTPGNLATALAALMGETPVRQAQLAALAELKDRLTLVSGTPSDVAASVVIDHLQ